MNYMEQVAKMLGVELGERFNIDFGIYDNFNRNFDYYLSKSGIVLDSKDHSCISNDVLCGIIYGYYTIKRKPWKPRDAEDDFWYVDADREVCRFSHFCSKDADYMNYYKLGNCYRTKEEAESNLDKWTAFYESDEVLEV